MNNRIAIGVASGAACLLASGFLWKATKSNDGCVRYSGSRIQDHGMKNYTFISDKKYELINVAIFVRHGARTPNYFVDSKYEMPDWESGITYVDMLPELCYDADLTELPSNKLITEESIFNEYLARRSDCCWGQLTLVGQEQSLEFGRQIRRIYMPRLLQEEFHERQILCRSTKYPRTYYTLKGILTGIYGIKSFDNCHRPIIYTMPIDQDPLFPNPNVCSAISKFIPIGFDEIAKDRDVINMKCLLREILGVERLSYTTPDEAREKQDMDDCERELKKSKGKGDEAKAANVKDDKVTIYAVRDDFHSRLVHEFDFPNKMFPLKSEIDRLASKEILSEYMGGSKDWEGKILLLVSPALSFLKDNMELSIAELKRRELAGSCVPDLNGILMKKEVAMKMQMVSCHDTTLIPLLMSLRCYKAEWPPFMANLIVELYRERQTGVFYVRVLYNGVAQRIVTDELHCSIRDNLNIMPYEDFKKYMEKYSVPASKYAESCDKAMRLFVAGKPVVRDQII